MQFRPSPRPVIWILGLDLSSISSKNSSLILISYTGTSCYPSEEPIYRFESKTNSSFQQKQFVYRKTTVLKNSEFCILNSEFLIKLEKKFDFCLFFFCLPLLFVVNCPIQCYHFKKLSETVVGFSSYTCWLVT